MSKINTKTEVLARAWIECDPNRNGSDPDAPILPASDGSGNEAVTDLTGKPRWHWFIPRAEALEAYLADRGWAVVETRLLGPVGKEAW